MSNYNSNPLITNFNQTLAINPSNIRYLQHSSTQVNDNRFIIDERTNPTTKIQQIKYPVDIINPINREYLKQVISIDAQFRDTPETSTTTDFTFTLQEQMRDVISMKVSSIELPNIWYSFSSKKRNNEFILVMKNMNDGSGNFYDATYKIVIPDGNYTVDEFERNINNIFKNLDPRRGPDFLKLEVDNITGRLIIRARDINDQDIGISPIAYDPTNQYYSPNFFYIIDFEIEDLPDRPLHKNCGWMLGFLKPFYIAENDFESLTYNPDFRITFRNYIKGEAIYGNGINTYIFLELDDFNNNFKDTVYSGKEEYHLNNNIISRIPVSSGSNTFMINTTADLIFKQRDYLGPVKIDKLKVRILDKYGDVIDINNNNFSFSLEFVQLYNTK
jgi:hypothetical protein